MVTTLPSCSEIFQSFRQCAEMQLGRCEDMHEHNFFFPPCLFWIPWGIYLLHLAQAMAPVFPLEQRRRRWECQSWPSAEEGSGAPWEAGWLRICTPWETKWQPTGLDEHWQKAFKNGNKTGRMCKSPSLGLQSFISISAACTLSRVEQGRLGAWVSADKCHPSNPSLLCRFLEALCTVVLLHLSLPRISLWLDYKWRNHRII